ncbi:MULTISPECIES: hypothetical protein [unclassified Mesorhizobium]|uniref:hypothetical protein n=1 Tax=unclassified Mesorhizobium TaxID=325217 RepID=UPI001FE1704B|nr:MULTISPECIES: hypothetical protein [unclassified Mesorhizobium]
MKVNGLDRRRNHEIGFQALDLGVQRGLALDQLLGRQHALDHEVDHPLQLAAPLFQLALDPAPIARCFEGEPAALGDIGLDIEGHGLRIGELIAQAIDHSALDHRQCVFLRVVTCARLAGTRAADARLADLRLPVHRHAAATAPAA